MGKIDYFLAAILTIPLALWDLADFGIGIYKFSFHDTPLGAYGYNELWTILVVGCFKVPVALICIFICVKTVMDAGCCGDDSVEKWTKANDVLQVPKLITALCDIPLLICNVRILGTMTADGLSTSPSQLVSTALFNDLTTALYASIVMEVTIEVGKSLFRIAGYMNKFGCECLTCSEEEGQKGNGWLLLLELAFLGMAFFCLRISYDLLLLGTTQTTQALYVIAATNFCLGYFYDAFRFWLDKVLESQKNQSMQKYLGCTTSCTPDNLDCAALFLFIITVLYLVLSVILSAIILGMGYPDNAIFQFCTIATIIMAGFLLGWLFLARIIAQCCGSGDAAPAQGVEVP